MAVRHENIELAFAMLEEAAASGARCPVSGRGWEGALPSGATTILAREGRIRVEVYPKNFRVVEILTGRHKGKRTLAPPDKRWKPYLIIGAQTTRMLQSGQARIRASAALGARLRPQPSPPRTLSTEELRRRV